MAASAAATMAVTGTVVVPMRATNLGSSSAFGSSVVRIAPLRPAAKLYSVSARASLPEVEQSGRTARREMLAGLVAIGAALSTSAKAFADTPEEGADELLKAADKLTTDESPPRFGPGRVGDADPGTIAQQGGSGAIEGLQSAGGGSVEGSKNAFEEAKEKIQGIFGQNGAVGDVSALDVSSPDSVKEKVGSDLDTAGGTAKESFSGLGDKVGSADTIVSDAKSKVGSVAGDAKSAAGDLKSEGKKIVDSISGQSLNLVSE